VALLKLVRIVDERNYDYITRIRTGFWEKRKGETNGQTDEWKNEWMNELRMEERKKQKNAVNE
jgi:hypothetical protein